ncbi:MAG: DUF3098 domain-containing protein [Planctomycetia bacterium]|nr:DUF3098 domain-containing protein [Planctomycetia bacterium]
MSDDKKQSKVVHLFEGWAFKKINYIIFLVGLLLIVSGYIIMAMGEVDSFQSITLAPILLFLGYVVAIPIALIYRPKK